MKIVFMGTPDFAVPSLKALIKSEFTISAVITQPDRPRGRGRKVMPSSVKEAAVESNLTVYQPEKIKEESFVTLLKEINPDLVAVVAFGQILPKEVIEIPRLGCINVHASLLPRYRGAAPIQRAIMEGEKETGITTMMIDQGLDTGDMLLQKKTPIFPEENFGSLHNRLSEIGAELLIETIRQLVCGKLKAVSQNNQQATYAPPINRDDEIINWDNPAIEIENKIRSLDPCPGAKTKLNNKVFKIWKVRIPDRSEMFCASQDNVSVKTGQVINVGDKRLFVQCSDKLLEILDVQLECSRRMAVGDFLRGIKTVTGTTLG